MCVFNFILFLSLAAVSLAEISCRNANGEAVDWFIGYKLPKVTDTEQIGDGFLYADLDNLRWSTPENISLVESSVGQTMKQYYDLKDDPDVFYLMHNDAHPDGKGDSYRGHSKGTVLFDEASGFWLIHSVPNFPDPNSYVYPSSGYNNGQSFLCISLYTEALTALGQHFTFTMPSIYNSQLPSTFAEQFPVLQDVIAKKSLAKNITVYSTVQEIKSVHGMQFVTFAKHKKFAADLYADLLAPYTQCSFFTETWPNGATNFANTCNTTHTDIYNIKSIDINGFTFTTTKDHSKWAVADNVDCGYVCIGDINRQVSQTKRAGGTVCFQQLTFWNMYRQSVSDVEGCPVE